MEELDVRNEPSKSTSQTLQWLKKNGFEGRPLVSEWKKGSPVLVLLDETTRKNISRAEGFDPLFKPSIALFLNPDSVTQDSVGMIKNSTGEYVLISIDPNTERPFTVKVKPNHADHAQRPYIVAQRSIYPISREQLEVVSKLLEINPQ